MNNLCWEIFKNTGSIEAYLYLKDYKSLNEEVEITREIEVDYDSIEHPGDST